MRWECVPSALAHRETSDEFGNPVLELYHDYTGPSFLLRLVLLARVAAPATPLPADVNCPTEGAGAFRLPSSLCARTPAIEALAAAVRREPRRRRAVTACRMAHASLTYQAGENYPGAGADEALARGSGVCQDFAHLMIALCRASGLAARYVSGYSPGTGLSHAWVEVLEGEGWQAWDPTFNRPPTGIAVAAGRDYRDVKPLQGTFRGTSRVRLRVRCQTRVQN